MADYDAGAVSNVGVGEFVGADGIIGKNYDAGAVSDVDVGELSGTYGITGQNYDAGVGSASYYLTEIFGEEPLDPVYDIGQVTDLLKSGGGSSVSFRTIPKLIRSLP